MIAADLFSLPASLQRFATFFAPEMAPWEWVRQIGPALQGLETSRPAQVPPGVHLEGPVYVDPTVKLPPMAVLVGPLFLGPGVEVRPGAYVRGNVIVGAGAVLGNSCEFKNALVLERAQVPHFSYVGDSILGNRSHLGAGVILSNLRLDQKPISVRTPAGVTPTGLRKLGALVGDDAEVGCNAVLQPGTILGKRALVLPTLAYGGTLAANQIARERTEQSTLTRRD